MNTNRLWKMEGKLNFRHRDSGPLWEMNFTCPVQLIHLGGKERKRTKPRRGKNERRKN